MPERTITSKEMTLRNLASDITSEIRNQIQDQDILNIRPKGIQKIVLMKE